MRLPFVWRKAYSLCRSVNCLSQTWINDGFLCTIISYAVTREKLAVTLRSHSQLESINHRRSYLWPISIKKQWLLRLQVFPSLKLCMDETFSLLNYAWMRLCPFVVIFINRLFVIQVWKRWLPLGLEMDLFQKTTGSKQLNLFQKSELVWAVSFQLLHYYLFNFCMEIFMY